MILLRNEKTSLKRLSLVQKNLEQLNEIFVIIEDRVLKSSKQTKNLLSSDNNEKSMFFVLFSSAFFQEIASCFGEIISNCFVGVEDSEDEEIEISMDEEDSGAIEPDVKDSGREPDMYSSCERYHLML